ncbi:hypothetical protein [Massilia sp. CCM 8734]|uniref:hypothetical protein n=1 Tax=Massilia sp. CCM 8734 TaxID=2609283 RepID=UPI00141E5C77|nr:hypothetical protein [Massilia sp. CCM 8734]NHZ99034.1 hypothetical protein [Massilia sp. CCM 8734]
MAASVVDLLARRRVFCRFLASASAAAARALADGHTVAVWDGEKLYRLYPDGRRESIHQDVDDEAPERP